MNSPRVIELPRRLEPVASDPFLDRPAILGEVIELRQPQDPAGPQPPLPAA